jgi:glycosyltransferase involved in cell wall biosynthesis
MRILFLTDNFPPEVNAPASRTYEHCVEWVKSGAEVTVITCAPNFPIGKVFDGYRNRWYQEEDMDGIRVIRVWSYISANAGFTKRILDYISFAMTSFIASWFVKTDIILATSPQFFTAVSGYAASLFKRRPWIMEVRDLWPESIRAVNAMEDSRMLDWLEKLELFLYRKAAKVVVVTDSFRKNIADRGIDPEKIEVVKNGVHLDKFQPRPKDQALLAQLPQLLDQFVVGYLGTHGMAHKLDFILECAPDAPDNVHFLFIGDGAEKPGLLNMKERMGLSNVTFLPPVPKHEIARYISLTDAALVPLKKSDTFKTVIPSKIFENASMEKPILLGVEGESQAIIEKYQAGLCFEPENRADFQKQLQAIATDAPLNKQLQQGCRVLSRNFNRKTLARKLYQVIETVTS